MSKERFGETDKLESIRNSLKSLELYEVLSFVDKQVKQAHKLEGKVKRMVETIEDYEEVNYTIHRRSTKIRQQNFHYYEARKKIELKYDQEFHIQNNEYMGGFTDGLMAAISIIDEELEEWE